MASCTNKGSCSKVFGPLNFEYNHVLNSTETKCLLCEEIFELSTAVIAFLKHLFEEHNLVIDKVEEIEELPQYITYWQKRFITSPLEEIIPSLSVDCTGKTYFLLSSLLKEDKELRHKLKLDYVMKVQEFERKDTGFKRPCLFCRLIFEGSRHGYLNHLAEQHNIQLGNPFNLVYIEEMVDKIDNKFKELTCMYCEKKFPDRTVLKEHMRKKLHKQINHKNVQYDKYYVVNYLEPDKTWRDIQKEDDRYAIIPGMEPNSDEEYKDWNEDFEGITCFFCDIKAPGICALCVHMTGLHRFRFMDDTETFDFYQKVKLVNYIRKQVHNVRCMFCDLACEDAEKLDRHCLHEGHYKVPALNVFDQPEFYFPTYEDDPFLYYLEDLDEPLKQMQSLNVKHEIYANS